LPEQRLFSKSSTQAICHRPSPRAPQQLSARAHPRKATLQPSRGLASRCRTPCTTHGSFSPAIPRAPPVVGLGSPILFLSVHLSHANSIQSGVLACLKHSSLFKVDVVRPVPPASLGGPGGCSFPQRVFDSPQGAACTALHPASKQGRLRGPAVVMGVASPVLTCNACN